MKINNHMFILKNKYYLKIFYDIFTILIRDNCKVSKCEINQYIIRIKKNDDANAI